MALRAQVTHNTKNRINLVLEKNFFHCGMHLPILIGVVNTSEHLPLLMGWGQLFSVHASAVCKDEDQSSPAFSSSTLALHSSFLEVIYSMHIITSVAGWSAVCPNKPFHFETPNYDLYI